MKKTIYILIFSILFTSCDSLSDLLELNINNDLTESVDVSVTQTSSTPEAFDKTKTVDLNTGDLADYRGKITAVKINTFTYKIKNFTGNTAGTIPSGKLKFNDLIVDEISDFNISQAASAGTSFEITDTNLLASIESAFLNNNTATIKLTGTVLSEAGSMNFQIEVFMNMTATIKD